MSKAKRIYKVISGEGDGNGTTETTRPLTDIGIKRRLTRERCGGDRWASAYYRCESDASNVWINCETGEARHID
jgi:hypothetical protein